MVKIPQTPCPPFPCPPPPQPPCPQVCPPPPPPPVCRVKPPMRGLHWAQTTRKLTEALLCSAFAGLAVYMLYTRPRMERYREFYANMCTSSDEEEALLLALEADENNRLAEFDDWADEMAKKGLFQAVPKEGFPKKDKK